MAAITDLVPVEPAQPFTNRQLDLIKTTIAPGVDDDQLALFVEVARRTGLDPFSRQIYAILRNAREKDADGRWHTAKRMTIQTGIDGYRAIAARTGSLAGIDDAVYGTLDTDGHPTFATVTVYRLLLGGHVAHFTATARWQEYAVYKDEYGDDNKKTGRKVLSDMWDRMPYLMLGKCAEALALRKAFPNEIAGVYTAEEMAQADNDAPRHVEHAGRTVVAETGEIVQSSATSLIVPRPDEVMRQRIADQEAARKAQPEQEPARKMGKRLQALQTRMRKLGVTGMRAADELTMAACQKAWAQCTDLDADAIEAEVKRREDEPDITFEVVEPEPTLEGLPVVGRN